MAENAEKNVRGMGLGSYPVEKPMEERLDQAFTYHPVKGDQAERYVALRAQAKDLAIAIVALSPVSREQSLALTKLEEAIFWANAGIARHE